MTEVVQGHSQDWVFLDSAVRAAAEWMGSVLVLSPIPEGPPRGPLPMIS